MSWVVTAYLLAETVATVLVGKFGDLFGRKIVFQLSAIIFITGSFLCGLATNMTLLIVWRGLQGIGAGGLMVTSMALIADVIPLRDRGKYQGAIGAVFGVSTVIGPLLGGLFTDHLTWRWAFYVNVPIAIVVVIAAARTIPSVKAAGRPVIDYLGIAMVTVGASSLILATSWGGNEYAWGSPSSSACSSSAWSPSPRSASSSSGRRNRCCRCGCSTIRSSRSARSSASSWASRCSAR